MNSPWITDFWAKSVEWEQRQYSCARRSNETFNLLLNNEKIGHYSRNQGFRSWGVAFPGGVAFITSWVGRNSWGRGQVGRGQQRWPGRRGASALPARTAQACGPETGGRPASEAPGPWKRGDKGRASDRPAAPPAQPCGAPWPCCCCCCCSRPPRAPQPLPLPSRKPKPRRACSGASSKVTTASHWGWGRGGQGRGAEADSKGGSQRDTKKGATDRQGGGLRGRGDWAGQTGGRNKEMMGQTEVGRGQGRVRTGDRMRVGWSGPESQEDGEIRGGREKGTGLEGHPRSTPHLLQAWGICLWPLSRNCPAQRTRALAGEGTLQPHLEPTCSSPGPQAGENRGQRAVANHLPHFGCPPVAWGGCHRGAALKPWRQACGSVRNIQGYGGGLGFPLPQWTPPKTHFWGPLPQAQHQGLGVGIRALVGDRHVPSLASFWIIKIVLRLKQWYVHWHLCSVFCGPVLGAQATGLSGACGQQKS